MSNKPRFKIVTDTNGVDSLTDGAGKPVPCIYSNPTALPHPTIAGQVIIHQKACNSLCQAFLTQDDYKGNKHLYLHCIGHSADL